MTGNPSQAKCNHVFVGRPNGVCCSVCGLFLTRAEYYDLLHPPEKRPTTAQNAKAKGKPKGGRKARQNAS